jgi:hypothetical protein
MSTTPSHDLHDWFQSVSNRLAEKYDQIRKRVAEDPGTAGDRGEESWREILEDWLPPGYAVERAEFLGLTG